MSGDISIMSNNETSSVGGLSVRRWYYFSEFIEATEFDDTDSGGVVRKSAVAAAVKNPYVGRFSADLSDLIDPSLELGVEFGERIKDLCGSDVVESYGKSCVVGSGGEYEHGNALLTTRFANPVRDAIGGGKAWVPSTGKIGGPGTIVDVPLAHKDALYVRSHYDTYSLFFGDGPRHDEIIAIFVVASRGRITPRVGGLTVGEMVGNNGLN